MFGAGLTHKTITNGLETSRICRKWDINLGNWADQVVKRNAGNYLCVWNCQRGDDYNWIEILDRSMKWVWKHYISQAPA